MNKEFGSCCKDLYDAIKVPPTSLFRVDNNVHYTSVGYVLTEQGPGWFDQAIIFCPFCGIKLQDKNEIKKLANQ